MVMSHAKSGSPLEVRTEKNPFNYVLDLNTFPFSETN